MSAEISYSYEDIKQRLTRRMGYGNANPQLERDCAWLLQEVDRLTLLVEILKAKHESGQ